jgi:hypothetical protein
MDMEKLRIYSHRECGIMRFGDFEALKKLPEGKELYETYRIVLDVAVRAWRNNISFTFGPTNCDASMGDTRTDHCVWKCWGTTLSSDRKRSHPIKGIGATPELAQINMCTNATKVQNKLDGHEE